MTLKPNMARLSFSALFFFSSAVKAADCCSIYWGLLESESQTQKEKKRASGGKFGLFVG